MKKNVVFPLLLLSMASFAQNKDPRLTEIWQPEPKIVAPGKTAADAPADAIVLFNGKDLAEWQTDDGKPAKWKVEGDAVTVMKGTGVIKTKRAFGDCQLHVEWRTPGEVKGEGQGRGNSGIFLMGLYELQVLDSYNNRTYSNGQAGSIYKQTAPLANASRKPGEWQTYDIIFTAPRFNKDSSVKSQGRITVLHNGVLVQNSTAIWGATQYIGIATNTWHKEKEPIVLQDHGDAVSFRNIWIRELE
ncbi:DUF1080 domain-containing protein [Niabella yanshanensis]|uniref:DUF1080 domain-containing protein n=1 Tax=Niabella yanshanensis TaxID=577386 RepID=A0ABZ0W5M0_9BACT|nr:DUF1080 domain-containing protein [Niabella yanshanensis]WQD37918.1 DUF1080 domain-containing protein [Niabella yanshanensis]